MKSLTGLTNISNNYLKQGNRPRVLVSVADARDGSIEGRYWASQQYTTADGNAYSDRIHSARTIRQTIEPFGGMSAVSGTNLSILKSDTNINFYQSTTLDTTPHPTAAIEGHGRFIKTGTGAASYPATQAATDADSISNSALTIGQRWTGSQFTIYRAFLQYTIPALSSVEDAYITLAGNRDESDTNFTIQAYAGTWSIGEYSVFDYDSWDMTDTDSNLIESFTTSANTVTYGSTYHLRFNRTGRDLIKNSYGGGSAILPLVLVSSRDQNTDEPTGDEYIKFTPSTMPTLTLQYNTVKPDNRTATIYLGYADSSGDLPIDEDNMLQLWTGVVDKYTLDPAVFDMQLRHDDFRHNVLIPQDIISTDTFPDCPEGNVGKPYPIVIGKATHLTTGEHKTGIGRIQYWEDYYRNGQEQSGHFDYFPSPIINLGKDGITDPIEVLVSTLPINYFQRYGWVATWAPSVDAYGRFVSTTSQVPTWNSDGYSISKVYGDRRWALGTGVGVQKRGGINPDQDNWESFRGTAVSVVPNYLDKAFTENNYDPDEIFTDNGATLTDVGDYIGVSPAGIGTALTGDKIEWMFEIDTTSATLSLNYAVFNKDRLDIESGTNGAFTFINGGSSYFDSTGALFSTKNVSADDRLVIFSRSFPIISTDSETRLTIQIKSIDQDHLDDVFGTNIDYTIMGTDTTASSRFTGDTGDTVPANVNKGINALDVTADLTRSSENYMVSVEIYTESYSPVVYFPQLVYYTNQEDVLLELYSDKQGELDGATLYEIPAHVIQGLAINYGGLHDANEINNAAFNDARTKLANWVFGFQLPIDGKEQKSLFTFNGKKGIMHELAEQCKSSLFFDNEGKLKIKVFNDSDSFPNSGTNVPDDLDIFEYSGSPTSNSFVRNGIVSGSYKIDIMDINKVYSDFKVKYNLRYGDQKYINNVYMNHGDGIVADIDTNIDSTNLEDSSTLAELKLYVSGAYNNLNSKTNTLVYEAWAIRQEATATKFLQSLIEWHSRRRYIVEFDTYFSAIAFEEADFINIRTPDIESTFGTATMNSKKWKIIEFSPNLSNFTIHIKAIEAEIY